MNKYITLVDVDPCFVVDQIDNISKTNLSDLSRKIVLGSHSIYKESGCFNNIQYTINNGLESTIIFINDAKTKNPSLSMRITSKYGDFKNYIYVISTCKLPLNQTSAKSIKTVISNITSIVEIFKHLQHSRNPVIKPVSVRDAIHIWNNKDCCVPPQHTLELHHLYEHIRTHIREITKLKRVVIKGKIRRFLMVYDAREKYMYLSYSNDVVFYKCFDFNLDRKLVTIDDMVYLKYPGLMFFLNYLQKHNLTDKFINSFQIINTRD